MIVRRAFLVLLLICLGCSAQSPPAVSSASPSAPSDLTRAIERQVRAHYSLPPAVKVVLGPLHSSEFANYDALTVTFAAPDKKQDFEFLLSHDHKSLLRMTKLDLTADPYAGHHEKNRCQRASDARQQGRQGRGRQLRRFRMPVLLAHARDAFSRFV
jgi:hypothetical protein